MKKVSVFAAIVWVMLSLSAQSADAQNKIGEAERILLQLANRDRATQGLPPLKWNSALADAARGHARRMAQQNTLSHQFPGEPGVADRASREGARFSTIAENVAEGPSAEGIHQQWMHSAPHRANLLDVGLDSVGIAVVDRSGTLFAAEDFSLAVGDLSTGEQEKLIVAQLQKRGLRPLSYTEDARRSCVLDNGYAGSHRPSFVLHYATSDLNSLPDMLEDRIQTGKYRSAVVGACPSNGKTAFASYRIAVLLYE